MSSSISDWAWAYRLLVAAAVSHGNRRPRALETSAGAGLVGFAAAERLGADDLAQELSSMLGGASDSLRGAATEMLAAAGHVKAQVAR